MELPPLNDATIKTLKTNPATLSRMLSADEFDCLSVLAKAQHALTAKAVQRAIIEQKIQADFNRLQGRPNRLLTTKTTNEIIALARHLKLEPPSDKTVKRALESLTIQGFAQKRLTAEGSKANALYFVNLELLQVKGTRVVLGLKADE